MDAIESGRQPADKRKMILFMGGLIVAGFIAASLISYLVSRDAIRQSIITTELPLTSENINSEIRRLLLQPIFVSSLMANDSFLKGWVDKGEQDVEEIKAFLGRYQKKYKTTTAFFISAASGRFYQTQGMAKTLNPDDVQDLWFFKMGENIVPYQINITTSPPGQGRKSIFINYKVFDFSGRFLGVTGVGLTLDALTRQIQKFSGRFQRNFYFFNRQGILVLQSTLDSKTSRPVHSITDIAGLDAFSDQILTGNLTNFEYQNIDSNILVNVRFIPDLNWILVIEQTEDFTRDILIKTLIVNLSICLIISFIVLAIIRVTIKRYRSSLEYRNQQLELKNQQISEQRAQLERKTDQLQSANKKLAVLNHEKDEFIGITAHDLKSPMNGIVGFAELINRNPKNDAETQEFASYILQSSLKMVERINTLLDIHQAEEDFELKLEPFDFRQPVYRTIEDFKYQARTKELEIKTAFPEVPMMTMANEKWMIEIIGNLVSNAIKYSPQKAEINLKLAKNGEKVRLEVEDEGPGIAADELPKLFGKYSKASSQPTGGETSTGLGLYIVKKMAQRMGGATWCESKLGKGSRFIVEFPAA